ncbi:putative 12-oxophytodienoate reductase 11 [Hypsibius exemplaris]|uniref:12-oxophytodienoate reductase 11 n=1 Tax=Hypsibius exemplaris TaxID=2072580 RepID=A0A1W0X7A6_HYPEX|nr:putative 12-oxophytodienoate reductase 11 [Hypsibius exemplaris]
MQQSKIFLKIFTNEFHQPRSKAIVFPMEQIMRYSIGICLILLSCVRYGESKATLCISETYAGQCEDDDQACAQSCSEENLKGGKCDAFRSTSVCCCEGCSRATTVATRKAVSRPVASTANPFLAAVLQRSAAQRKPIFLLNEISPENCAATKTDYCAIYNEKEYSDHCSPNRHLFIYCSAGAGEFEAGYFLQKVLNFNKCQRIVIQRDDFLPFPSLRVLWYGGGSTIASIEENAFDSLLYLRHITFEQGFDTFSELASGLRNHLKLLHCTPEYKWLRDWLQQRPYLLSPKKAWELYDMGGMGNGEQLKGTIFIPVDCATSNLIADDKRRTIFFAHGNVAVSCDSCFNQHTYKDNCLKPMLENLPYGREANLAILYQDKAPCHAAGTVQSLRKERVNKHGLISSFDRLAKILQDEWEAISQQVIQDSINSWMSWVCKVEKAREGATCCSDESPDVKVKTLTCSLTGMAPLFTTMKIGGLQLSHRIIMAPLTRCRGLIVSEATNINRQSVGHFCAPGIWTPEQVDAWKGIVSAIHAKGGFIFLQLWHVGRGSHSAYQPDGRPPVGPSPIAIKGETSLPDGTKAPFEVPRELTVKDIAALLEDYRKATKNAFLAGFDGVEVHGANGYLIDQFLHDGSNQRTDKYGGSIENRARFLFEVVEAVQKVWIDAAGAGTSKAAYVGLRLSPFGKYQDMSDRREAELYGYVIPNLNRFNLAYLHVVEPCVSAGPNAIAVVDTLGK